MIPLTLGAKAEGRRPFVTRARCTTAGDPSPADSMLVADADGELAFSGARGLITIAANRIDIDGDVLLVDPGRGAAERLLRAGSLHNTLLVTERCDQLCVMCSQPPKKTHIDRFAHFQEACALAPPGMLIGISGGEPTLYKQQLFELIEHTLEARADLAFHILSNGQHFEPADRERLLNPVYRRVTWGIPLYSADALLHDRIVGKVGAFERLEESFATLVESGARLELRTVIVQTNVEGLHRLAERIAVRLPFIESWAIMQLENIGFAKNRWSDLYFDHGGNFAPIAGALNFASLHAIQARLFNFPLCTVPHEYRHLAPPSISDWKRKYAPQCEGCSARQSCSGFFEWHPQGGLFEKVSPI